jgi:hypothetical protein
MAKKIKVKIEHTQIMNVITTKPIAIPRYFGLGKH